MKKMKQNSMLVKITMGDNPMPDTTKPSKPGRNFFFSLVLVLVVLTQVVVFHWGSETIFFVTWLLVVLSIRHESRLSAAVGLLFLASCPFLIIYKKDALAEQAANYAYLFLVIGVLTQMEEMILEHFGWSDRKLDFSPAWLPVDRTVRRFFRMVFEKSEFLIRKVSLSVQPNPAGPNILPRWIAHSRWLSPGGILLIVLLLAIPMTIWMFNLQGGSSLTSMKTSYIFIDHLGEALHPTPPDVGENETVQEWAIGNVTQKVLFQHPAFSGNARLQYQVQVPPGSKLAFDIAMSPESWKLEGDGVAFRIYVTAGGITHQVFSAYINPKQNKDEQRWNSNVIELNAYGGRLVTFIFETNVGPLGDFRNDWAGWGNPRLLTP